MMARRAGPLLRTALAALRISEFVSPSIVHAEQSRLKRVAKYFFVFAIALFVVSLVFRVEVLAWLSTVPMAFARLYQLMADCIKPDISPPSEAK